MNTANRFSGYKRKPSESEVLLFLSVLCYLKDKFGIKYTSYVDHPGGPIKARTISNAGTHRSMAAEAYEALTLKVHNNLTSSAARRMEELDDYIRPLVFQLFPDLNPGAVKPEFEQPVEDNVDSIFLRYASGESSTLDLLHKKFSEGGFIYRFARNAENEGKKKPRLAKGKISVSKSENSHYLNFLIEHYVDTDNDLDPYNSRIRGRVMLIKSFFVFVGIETEKHNPFFMVMKAELPGSRFRGLILRKHPIKSYFSSRVVLSTIKPDNTNTGKFTEGELPEVSTRQLRWMKNTVANSGKSILMLED
ncbi:MAG: hypothetical protein AAGB04_28775 [Pseudomonadota bacterium]